MIPVECPSCGAILVRIYQPNSDNLDRLECVGPERHAFPVLVDEQGEEVLGDP